jgi:hypothetical protein
MRTIILPPRSTSWPLRLFGASLKNLTTCPVNRPPTSSLSDLVLGFWLMYFSLTMSPSSHWNARRTRTHARRTRTNARRTRSHARRTRTQDTHARTQDTLARTQDTHAGHARTHAGHARTATQVTHAGHMEPLQHIFSFSKSVSFQVFRLSKTLTVKLQTRNFRHILEIQSVQCTLSLISYAVAAVHLRCYLIRI